ncbi:group I truncated hemoglobin [Chachezhania sediminis]|uniref:group I truncated hemoglobin n=1 Tax=Chachezhania sediminis TaxID=2599291 RepID=UPI001E36FB08|nr:group 1 truncated hemoglobin [Chachezhania sediminis]
MTTAVTRSRSLPLFEKYGGIRMLRNVIMDFYDRVLDSDTLGPYFDDVDMTRLIDHQTKFFAMMMGGPVDFSDDRLARAHASMAITHAEFDEIAALLTETLTAAGLEPVDIVTILTSVERRRSVIVRR